MPLTATHECRSNARAISARWLCGLVALVILLCFTSPAEANTSFFLNTGSVCTTSPWNPCWQAGSFGILVGLGTAVGSTGRIIETGPSPTDNIKGNGTGGDVGIGSGSLINTSGGSATQNWTGPVDFADACSPSCSTTNTFSVPSSSDNLTHVTLIGGTTVGNSVVIAALNEVLSISSYWSSASGEHSLGTLTGGTTIGSIGGGVQVFSVNSINLTSALTIRGGANDLVIINDPHNAIIAANITLTGGITPDQVLFNITGTGNDILSINGGAGRSTDMADFIVRGSWYATNATIDGRILGGWRTIVLGPNFEMSVPNDIPEFPEPSTWLLLLTGVGAMFYFARRLPGRSRLPMSGRIRARMEADGDTRSGDVQAADLGEKDRSGGLGPPPPEPGIPPPRGGGGGGDGGVDCARLT